MFNYIYCIVLIFSRIYDLQFFDKVADIIAHDSEILTVEYSPLSDKCK